MKYEDIEMREEKIRSQHWKRKRDAMAQSYRQRVNEWTDDKHAKHDPRAQDVTEHNLYSLSGGRPIHKEKHLGHPRFTASSFLPEKERVALASKIYAERAVSPYKNPNCSDIRLREKEKEVHPPMRYRHRSQNERIVDVIEKAPVILASTNGEYSHPDNHVFRHFNPELWHAGKFNRTFGRVKAKPTEPMGHPAHVSEMIENPYIDPEMTAKDELYSPFNSRPFRPNLVKQIDGKPLYQTVARHPHSARRPNKPAPPKPRQGSMTVRDYRKNRKTYWRATKELGFGPNEERQHRPLYLKEFPPQETVNLE